MYKKPTTCIGFEITSLSCETVGLVTQEDQQDIADHSMDPKAEATLDQHVMDLYGLIHARYILTKRGMDKMVRLALLWRLNLGFWNGSSSTVDAVASRKTF